MTVHQKIRPKDVPGTLLNMALLNLGSLDPNLRTAAYNLLCALTATFDLKIEGQLLETSGKEETCRIPGIHSGICKYIVLCEFRLLPLRIFFIFLFCNIHTNTYFIVQHRDWLKSSRTGGVGGD